MFPTSAGVEPATSWSPVGRRIQLSHRGRLSQDNVPMDMCIQQRHRTACTWAGIAKDPMFIHINIEDWSGLIKKYVSLV